MLRATEQKLLVMEVGDKLVPVQSGKRLPVIPGDFVSARLYPGAKGEVAAPVRVLEPGSCQLFGRLSSLSDQKPENITVDFGYWKLPSMSPPPDFQPVSSARIVEAEVSRDDDGQLCVLSLTQQDCPEPGEDTYAWTILRFGLRDSFSDAVEQEAEQFDQESISAEIDARTGDNDLSDINFVTIDGDDARDFDDAVHCRANSDGFDLYVAVADVAHYVRPGGALDLEASERSSSVYFPGKVLPMLPHRLSDDLCSLVPGKPRLAMVCHMQIDRSGRCTSHRFVQSVIRSRARLTYGQVNQWIEDNKKHASHTQGQDSHTQGAEQDSHTQGQDNRTQGPDSHTQGTGQDSPTQGAEQDCPIRGKEFEDSLKNLHELYGVMINQPRARLAIEMAAYTFKLDDENRPISIAREIRGDSEKMIEEMMILANVACARTLSSPNGYGGFYRVHPEPARKSIDEISETFKQHFSELRLQRSPAIFNQCLRWLEGRDDSEFWNLFLVRHLQLATYSPDLDSHFGLDLSHYAHFTSPIRRYADLVNHRHIKQSLASKGRIYEQSELTDMSAVINAQVRCNDKAMYFQGDYMKLIVSQEYIGKTMDAIVDQLTPFGAFVFIPETGLSAFMHQSGIRGYYYDFSETCFMRRKGNGPQRIDQGSQLTIKLLSIDLDLQRADVIYVESH
ncbi:MAG: RNB domain-containing ribonuclease [Gammaproteobacteria bacterium]|nr:RNB domain-containing ribonuclease [Gammaproteobacteria bacterium]